MKKKLITAGIYNPGDKKKISPETKLGSIQFNVIKYNNRQKPQDKRKILIIFSLYEFGTEILSIQYCIPRLIHLNPGFYVIVVGWWGREYLYRHLSDEFWEIKEEYQWLREYADSFSHNSYNLKKLESSLKQFGHLATGKEMSLFCLRNMCKSCKHCFVSYDYINSICPKCKSEQIEKSLLSDAKNNRKSILPLPQPSLKKQVEAKKYIGTNPIGIFARQRMRYGRNLPADFYKKLITLLQFLGYSPIWLGEKQSVMPCPVNNILDFSRLPEAADLELTLAIVKHCKFTIQFWTASTRLASLVQVPWILFESPDQIVGSGQEGVRIALTTDWDKKKLVISDFNSVLEQQDLALEIVKKSILDIQNNDFSNIIGLVQDEVTVKEWLKKMNYWW